MNTKKLLAALLSAAMIATSAAVPVFAEEQNEEMPAIETVDAIYDVETASEVSIGNAAETKENATVDLETIDLKQRSISSSIDTYEKSNVSVIIGNDDITKLRDKIYAEYTADVIKANPKVQEKNWEKLYRSIPTKVELEDIEYNEADKTVSFSAQAYYSVWVSDSSADVDPENAGEAVQLTEDWVPFDAHDTAYITLSDIPEDFAVNGNKVKITHKHTNADGTESTYYYLDYNHPVENSKLRIAAHGLGEFTLNADQNDLSGLLGLSFMGGCV